MRPDGAVLGTVGGGAVEQLVLEALRGCLESGESALFVRELGHDLGMCCGGRMEVFIEPIEAPPRLWLCGAGHVGAATAPLAASVGFEVTVIDDREELLTPERFPGAVRVLDAPTSWLKRTTLDGRDWLLVTTHEHTLDEQVLELALTRPESAPRYVGLMGSKRKVFRLLERITARRGRLSLERVYGPVGVALGAIGPAEIAVSIVAELVALRRGEPVPHLSVVGDARLEKLLAEVRVGSEAE